MSGHTFRVFVSSTFTDLRAERDALQSCVFPRLRAVCEARGHKFQAIDLRWGVNEDAGRDQATMRLCLEEIARCQRSSPRANFIALLGDRYGWCPLPTSIGADDWDVLMSFVNDQDRRFLQETVPGDPTGGWYRRDENAIPPEYILKPRPQSDETWVPIERRLHGILVAA